MTWQCKLIDVIGTREVSWPAPPEGGKCGETRLLTPDGEEHSYGDLPPGTMFFVPRNPVIEGADGQDTRGWPWYHASEESLSDYYRQHNSSRLPLMVVLPGRHLFLIDGKCWNGSQLYGGWQVTGDAPAITVSPSINIGGSYHGWLQSGVISDDCEGRKFDAGGKSIA
jgi:hypothetical protein